MGSPGAAHAGCLFVFGGEGEPTHVLGLTPNTYAYDRGPTAGPSCPTCRSRCTG